MRKIITTTICALLFSFGLYAQQDAMFTKYMFNSLVYNPAYAGSKDHMAIGLLHRTQWWGIDGAPTTQSITAHTPLRNDRVGVGLNLINDVIGPTHSIQANISYAYRIPIGKSKLAIGVQGGVNSWRADWTKLSLEQQVDAAYDDPSPSFILPNFGGGIYFYNDRFYMGLGVPHLIEYDLRKKGLDGGEVETPIWAKQYRHYFFSTGAAIPLKGEMLVFKPSILIKNVGLLSGINKDEAYQNLGAPTEFDIDLSLMFYQAFWIGASFRSAFEAFDDTSSFDSVDLWASYYLQNGLRIGAAYDYTLTKLQGPAQGSFEVMLGYEFNYKTKQLVTPRYF
ncbi:MAG TPA: type IX secretion system membrane protein PorP/SprF [Phaeodactylibacter sp.]|nr:type IX secretion system membrane protein PorP/SprF [Phaeodactylibacter sp.]